jgi:hypothetical protein
LLNIFRTAVIAALVAALLPFSFAASASGQPPSCQEGTQPGGARYRVCLPGGAWNGDLVLYAHGYVAPTAPLALPGEGTQLSGVFLNRLRDLVQ